ncbi:MAG: thiamine phosphate synthase [Gammaproteobacteria bacterium]
MTSVPRHLASGMYAITDCAALQTPELLARTDRILAAGIAALQYRNKTASFDEKLIEASAIRSLCVKHGTPLIINDDVDLALAVCADGVHLGIGDLNCADARARLGDDAIIGISCYDDLESAVNAQKSGADYVAFGAFFPTTTKAPRATADLDLLRRARPILNVPVAAIGGITPENAAPLLSAGADILAVVRSLYGSADPADVVLRFNRLFQHPLRFRGATR